MYHVFLSVSDIYNEKQMLHKLQDIRLGAFYDLYPHVVYQELLQLESVFYRAFGSYPLGSGLHQISGKILERF